MSDMFRSSRLEEIEHEIVRPIAGLLTESLRNSKTGSRALDRLADQLPMRVVLALLRVPMELEPVMAKHVRVLALQIDTGGQPDATVRSALTRHATLVTEQLERGGLSGPLGRRFGAAERDGELSRDELDELVDNAVLLLLGGTQTSACGIANAITVLMRNCVVRSQVVAEEVDTKLVPREAMRLEPPVRFTPRFVRQRSAVGRVDLPSGSLVLLCLASANRDADAHPHPGARRVDRRVYPVTFGRGIHSCVGAHLGEL